MIKEVDYALILKFEDDMLADSSSRSNKMANSAAFNEILRKGLAFLPVIAEYFQQEKIGSGKTPQQKQKLTEGWNILLYRIRLEHDLPSTPHLMDGFDAWRQWVIDYDKKF